MKGIGQRMIDIVTNTGSRSNYEMPKPDFLPVSRLMDLFLESDKLTNVKLTALTLNLSGFRVYDDNIDLKCDNDSIKLLTSVKAYQTPLFSDIITLATIAKKEKAKGLIISNQKLPTEIVEKSLVEGVDLWGFDQLSDIILRLPTLSFLEDHIVKVKEGKELGFKEHMAKS